MKKNKLLALLLIVPALLLGACGQQGGEPTDGGDNSGDNSGGNGGDNGGNNGGDNGGDNGGESVSYTVVADPASAKIEEGQTVQINAVTTPANQAVTFESQNTSIATVNATGLVSAVATGRTSVKLTLTENTGVFSYFYIEVTERVPVLQSISVDATNAKKEYNVGDALDTSRLVVTAHYDNQTTAQVAVSECQITGFDSTAAVASQTITVTYQGKTATYTISIVESSSQTSTPEIDGIQVNATNAKTEYFVGDTFDATGLVITSHYDDDSTSPVAAGDCQITGFDSSAAVASQTITVTYLGQTATYTIKISELPTFTVDLEMNVSVFDGWSPEVSEISIYLFNDDGAVAETEEECKGNLDDGKATFVIDKPKVATKARLFFTQGSDTKYSTDMAVNISSDGEYIVNFVNHWDEVEEGVWKLDQMSITIKELTLNTSEVSVVAGNNTTAVATLWTGESLQVHSDHENIATATVDQNTGIITINGIDVGEATITVSDGVKTKTIAVTVQDPNLKFTVSFDMDISVPLSWGDTSEFSLYVFGSNDYVPVSRGNCVGNLDAGTVSFTIDQGKDITGIIFFFTQSGSTKESTVIAPASPITEAGYYIVNFVDSWDQVEEGVWKLNQISISVKELTLSTNSKAIEIGTPATVTASKWTGESLQVHSDHENIATATVNQETGVITITGVAAGNATITVSDGVVQKQIAVTVSTPAVKYSVTFECDVSSIVDWNPAPDNYSLYVKLDDDTELLGSFAECQNNMTKNGNTVSITVQVPEGRSIKLVIIYFTQNVVKRSNDIDLDPYISATGSYVVSLGMTSWSGDTFNGATVTPKP